MFSVVGCSQGKVLEKAIALGATVIGLDIVVDLLSPLAPSNHQYILLT